MSTAQAPDGGVVGLVKTLEAARSDVQGARSELDRVSRPLARTLHDLDDELKALIGLARGPNGPDLRFWQRLGQVSKSINDLHGVLAEAAVGSASWHSFLYDVFRAHHRKLIRPHPEPELMLRSIARSVRVMGRLFGGLATGGGIGGWIARLGAWTARVGTLLMALIQMATPQSLLGRILVGVVIIGGIVAAAISVGFGMLWNHGAATRFGWWILVAVLGCLLIVGAIRDYVVGWSWRVSPLQWLAIAGRWLRLAVGAAALTLLAIVLLNLVGMAPRVAVEWLTGLLRRS